MTNRFLSSTLLILTCLSLLFVSAIFVTSLFTPAVLSLWLNTISTILVVIYHIAILVISWRHMATSHSPESTRNSPSAVAYTVTSIACLCLILGMLVIALGVEMQSAADGSQHPRPLTGENSRWNVEIALCALMTIEVSNAVIILVHLIRVRRRVPVVYADGQEKGKSGWTVHDYDKSLFLPSPTAHTPLSRSGTTASRAEKVKSLFNPPKIPPPRTIRLKPPMPSKFRRNGTPWSYVTPARPSMLQFETPIRTTANYRFR
ncbi:hypothetical protein FPV67DRAFT_626227 [Lyophyllum atratum]|nr:hypothetical protein FPV67DRAFT_626227 [Lyophyllum atratum]